jgi:hypothetical protein
MTSAERTAREARIKGAMSQLVLDTRFGEFINVIREQREIAIEDLCSDRVLSSDRLTMAAVGEIRACKAIIAAYDEFVDRATDEQAQNIAE